MYFLRPQPQICYLRLGHFMGKPFWTSGDVYFGLHTWTYKISLVLIYLIKFWVWHVNQR